MKILAKIREITLDDLFAENEVLSGMATFVIHLLK